MRTAGSFLLRALVLLAFLACLLTPGDAPGAGKHRRKPKPAVEEEQSAGETPEAATEAGEEGTFPYPLYLTYGEAAGRGEPGRLVPPVDDFLRLFESARLLRLNPWGGDDPGGASRKPARGEEARLRNRLAYLRAKAGLFEELHELAATVARMSESLAAAGEWSRADAELAGLERVRVRLYGEENATRIALLEAALADAAAPGGPFRRRYDLDSPAGGLPEETAALLEEARATELRLAAYEGEILPALERIADGLAAAHARGEVGLPSAVLRRYAVLTARAERLDLVWRLNVLALELEERWGRPVPMREEVR